MSDWRSLPLSSLLFVPGSDPDKMGKVHRFGANLVVIDLEDAVAHSEKDAARGLTKQALAAMPSEQKVSVRVNAIDTGRLEEDVRAVIDDNLDAIVVPKVDDPATLAAVDSLLAEEERKHGREPGSIGLFAIIESAAGAADCERILREAPERTVTAILGAGDFTIDLGIELTSEATELFYIRSRLAIAARAAGLVKPIDGPFLDLQDVEGLERDSRLSRQLGFQGRVTVYPPQVEHVRRAYETLSDRERERLQRVVDMFEEAERQGIASIRHEGRFVDYPIYRRAKSLLESQGPEGIEAGRK